MKRDILIIAILSVVLACLATAEGIYLSRFITL